MPAIYNGLTLNPIQSFTVNQQTEFLPSGKLKKYIFNISLKGKIVAPQNISIEDKHNYIISQQAAIISAFNDSGSTTKKSFEVQPKNGGASFRCTPRIKSVNIEEGIWVDTADYSIEMEADSFTYGSLKVPSGNEINLESDEVWSIDFNDEDKRITKVSHKLSAKSKDTDTKKGWEIAKAAIDKKIDSLIPNDIKNVSGKDLENSHNKKKSYRVNILTGEVSADIQISYHDPIGDITNNYALHEQTITEKYGTDSARKKINVDGTVTGLLSVGGTSRYDPANSLWSEVKTSIEDEYSDLIILSSSVTKDKVKGIINYSYEIEDYQKAEDGSKSRRVTITQMGELANPPDVFIIHQTIYGSMTGPLFQDISTKKVHTKTVVIEAVNEGEPDLDTLQYRPATSIIDSDSTQISLNTGKRTRTTSFIWVE